MILAGDIGGTHARLAFFDVVDGHYNLIAASVFPSREYGGLDQIVSRFVTSSALRATSACFGIAGPVYNGRVETSNLPWIIESQRLADELKIRKATLINDLEATAWGVSTLGANDLFPLNEVKNLLPGNQAVIAAGTGLGQAGIYWDGSTHRAFACEGGHCDFAPRTDLEVELLSYLRPKFGHVSYERILSGPGLVNVYSFLRDTNRGAEPSWMAEEIASGDPAAAISKAGLDGRSELCERALDLFVSIYGAEAGNLALKHMSTGGLFLAGGIAPKLIPKLASPHFLEAFRDKGRLQYLMETIPIKVIINDALGLLGAARCAVVQSGV